MPELKNQPCTACRGEGMIEYHRTKTDPKLSPELPCSACNGSGSAFVQAMTPTPAKIDRFDGEYFFLSNFYPHMTTVEGRQITGEHLFQSLKCDSDEQAREILAAPTPGKAKRLGRRCQLRADWEEVKVDMMRGVLQEKFLSGTPESTRLADRLLTTGDAVLIEGNVWNDRFWGVDIATGKGSNMLGRLLMELRAQIRTADIRNRFVARDA